MALQYVGGITGSSAGATSGNLTIDLTSLTGGIDTLPIEGDIVIVGYSHPGADVNKNLISTGYTRLCDLFADDTFNTNFWAYYKIMGSTPDTSVVAPPSGDLSAAQTVVVHVWRGVNTSTPMDVTPTTATGINTGQPTPPVITPVTTGAIILCISGVGLNGSVAFTISDLENIKQVQRADDDYSSCGIGSYAWTTGAFTPAQWAGGTNVADSWAAITLALRPSLTSSTSNFFQLF